MKTQIDSEVANVCNTTITCESSTVVVYIVTSVVQTFLLQSANLRLTKLMTIVWSTQTILYMELNCYFNT